MTRNYNGEGRYKNWNTGNNNGEEIKKIKVEYEH
jgi:hypothetical protein